jgi:hypothetical protein
MRALTLSLLCVACYNPSIREGAFRCDSTNTFSCPDGFCCISGLCVSQGCAGSNRDGQLTPEQAGCSDATREALTSLAAYPDIAACDGAWDQQGVVDTTQQPHCNRQGGNDGVHADGVGCAAADLCSMGWHVCIDAADVQRHHGPAACGELAGSGAAFYATRQRGRMLDGVCVSGVDDSNNVNGCGSSSVGAPYAITDMCAPLNRRLMQLTNNCPSPWSCGTDDRVEGQNVTKTSGAGGVLCCHD